MSTTFTSLSQLVAQGQPGDSASWTPRQAYADERGRHLKTAILTARQDAAAITVTEIASGHTKARYLRPAHYESTVYPDIKVGVEGGFVMQSGYVFPSKKYVPAIPTEEAPRFSAKKLAEFHARAVEAFVG